MRIGVPSEVRDGERRVAVVPDSVRGLKSKLGESVGFAVERDAGVRACFSDSAYGEAGAELVDGAAAWGAELVVCVNAPTTQQAAMLREGGVLLGLLRPGADKDLLRALVERRITALAFESVPRITRAQRMDALSSMSTIAGYRAVIVAADAAPRLFPMLMTAAGTVTPAKALILGAGVAGLQAIATARRLGAVVSAYDVRAATREQIESLGARFVSLSASTGDAETAAGYARAQTEQEQQQQRDLLSEHVGAADIVITTALIPGRPAPRLIDRAGVEKMKPGSVIVDLAAEAGGNCELTRPDQRVDHNGVTILGPTNLPAGAALHASQLYSRNVAAMLEVIVAEGVVRINLEDELVHGSLLTHDGEVMHAGARAAMGLPPLESAAGSVKA